MSNIWFTSDWHLGHKAVLRFENSIRSTVLGVSTIEEHNKKIARAVASIGKRDILYVMGDNGNVQLAYDILATCKAMQIRYLPGNHDNAAGITSIWPLCEN